MRNCLSFAAVLLAVSVSSPATARADDFTDKVAKLTGVDTPQSQAIDKDVAQLLKNYDALMAQFKASQPSSKGRYLDQANDVFKRVLERAQAGADLRAQTAVQQRCVAGAANAAGGGGATSPYLCGAVRSAKPGSEPNDPWTVCACARQYVTGVAREIATIPARANGFIGRITEYDPISDYSSPPITAQSLAQRFKIAAHPVDPDALVAAELVTSFKWEARDAQRRIAEAEANTHRPGATTVPFRSPQAQAGALLQPAKRNAYYQVQEAGRRLWDVQWEETIMEIDVAQAAHNQQQARSQKDFKAKADAIMWRHDEQLRLAKSDYSLRNQLLRNQFAEQAALCPPSDAPEKGIVDAVIQQARRIASTFFEVRNRLIADMEAWKTFGLKDGAGTTLEAGVWNYQDEDFAKYIVKTFALAGRFKDGIPFWALSSRGVGELEPKCVQFGYFMGNAAEGYPLGSTPEQWHAAWGGTQEQLHAAWEAYNARLLAAVQRRYPEAVDIGSQISLLFTQVSRGQESEQVVSGASAGESP